MSKAITARDGFGNPVEWFMIIKLPKHTISAADLSLISTYGSPVTWNLTTANTHCDCPDPDCSDASVTPNVGHGRGSGLCYLYADSYNATLRWYSDVGNPLEPSSSLRMQCLGQGGRDPLSTTLTQLYANQAQPDVEWAFWNDQMESLSDSWNSNTCAYASRSNESFANGSYPYCTTVGSGLSTVC